MPKYKRILLKVSGEALAGDKHFGLCEETIGAITDKIKEAKNMEYEFKSLDEFE